jgi:hypothetical protein
MKVGIPRIKNLSESSQNLIAIIFGFGSQFLIQVLSIPLFLKQMTVQQYAVWIVSFSIAQIANFSDLGTITASQNSFAYLKNQKNPREISNRISQGININTVSILVLIFVLIITQFLLENIASIYLVITFIVSTYVQNFFGINEAIMRMNGKNSLGLNLSSSARLVEFTFYALLLSLGVTNLLVIGIGGTIAKITFFVILGIKVTDFFLIKNFESLDFKIISRMVKSGFPYAIMKISDVVTLSGLVIVLQNRLTSINLLLFVSLRTFLRFGLQFSNLINFSFYFKFSKNWAEGAQTEFLRNVKYNYWISALVLSILSLGYVFFGNYVFAYWTNGSFNLDSATFLCGVFYLIILVISQSQRVKFHAINANMRVSFIALFVGLANLLFLALNKNMIDLNQIFISMGVFEFMSILMVKFNTQKIINGVNFNHGHHVK